jgi:hypothetical protein
MSDAVAYVLGSEKLTGIFGRWPTFHDAEIVEFHLDRGDVRPEDGIYDFPRLTLKIHLWEMTREVDSKGFFILKHHTLAMLKFRDVDNLRLEGFNHQNAMMELLLTREERATAPSPYFAVEIPPAFGAQISFECLGIEVVNTAPCSADGRAIVSPPSEHPR